MDNQGKHNGKLEYVPQWMTMMHNKNNQTHESDHNLVLRKIMAHMESSQANEEKEMIIKVCGSRNTIITESER